MTLSQSLMSHWMEVQGQTVLNPRVAIQWFSIAQHKVLLLLLLSLVPLPSAVLSAQVPAEPRLTSGGPGALCVTSSSIPTPGVPPQLLLPTTTAKESQTSPGVFPLHCLLMQLTCLDIPLHRHPFFPSSLHFRLYILSFDPLHQKIGFFEA